MWWSTLIDLLKAPIFPENLFAKLQEKFSERILCPFDKPDDFSEGTVIRLALVKRIIEFHGDRIWVESTVVSGSTFYFTLQSAAYA